MHLADDTPQANWGPLVCGLPSQSRRVGSTKWFSGDIQKLSQHGVPADQQSTCEALSLRCHRHCHANPRQIRYAQDEIVSRKRKALTQEIAIDMLAPVGQHVPQEGHVSLNHRSRTQRRLNVMRSVSDVPIQARVGPGCNPLRKPFMTETSAVVEQWGKSTSGHVWRLSPDRFKNKAPVVLVPVRVANQSIEQQSLNPPLTPVLSH